MVTDCSLFYFMRTSGFKQTYEFTLVMARDRGMMQMKDYLLKAIG